MPRTLDRLIYVDDSGKPQTGLAVYGWIEFAPHDWASVLGRWLDNRKMLAREFGIPVERELHMTEYARGRGRVSNRVPSRHIRDGVTLWQDFGREVAETCLETLRCTEGLRVGSVYRQAAPEDIHQTKVTLYKDLVGRFEADLAESGSLAMVFMDGDGSDATYRTAHRELKRTDRHVIEDPILTDSKDSQLMQMADHVAWCANAATHRHTGNAYAQEWYATYLAERDQRREPHAM